MNNVDNALFWQTFSNEHTTGLMIEHGFIKLMLVYDKISRDIGHDRTFWPL